MKPLNVRALEIAKKEYEEAYGRDSWIEADKCEREDYAFAVYKRILKEENNSTKLNKEDNTMNKRDERMETLKVNGIDVGKYFNLTLPSGETVRMTLENGVPVVANDDPIMNQIIKDGYVRNTKLHRRWVMAQMFKMLGYKLMNFRNGISIVVEEGYDACLRNRYSYQYQFDMMLEEIRVISELERKDEETFKERTSFFNRDVVVKVCQAYMNDLKKYIETLPKHKCKGVPYKRIGGKYGDVFEADLYKKVYRPMECSISAMTYSYKYYGIYMELKKFMNLMIKLPYGTPKSKIWIDAFKGAGAYYTLKNLTMYHNCGIKVEVNQLPYITKKYEAGTEATDYVKSKLDEYRGQGWRYMAMLRKCIADNNFSFDERMKEVYSK